MSGKLEHETATSWSLTEYGKTWIDAWDRFWFTPKAPHTLGVIRIATGLMLLYAHLVTATHLFSFVGDDAWINNATIAGIHGGEYAPPDAARSYLWNISNPLLRGWLFDANHRAACVVVSTHAGSPDDRNPIWARPSHDDAGHVLDARAMWSRVFGGQYAAPKTLAQDRYESPIGVAAAR
jgi:hypothetical protein